MTKLVDQNVQQKIKAWDVISFKYKQISISGVPTNPEIYQVRTDLNWDNVLANMKRKKNMKRKCELILIEDTLFSTLLSSSMRRERKQ